MITSEQRELRTKYIGSSDSAAIMGLDEYRSAHDVWAEKTGKCEPFEGNENTERGNFLEPAILNWAQAELGADSLLRDVMRTHTGGVMAANFDAMSGGLHGFIVEAKSSVIPDEWGEAGTDEVPDRVVIQTHHAMYVAGPEYRVAWVPVLLPGYRSFDFRMYRVDRNDEVTARIVEHAHAFMDLVRRDIRPDDFRPSFEVLKRFRRVPKKTVPLAPELVDRWERMKSLRKWADETCDVAQAEILLALNDAEGGNLPDGRVLTYLEQTRKETIQKASTFRVMRLKASTAKLSDETIEARMRDVHAKLMGDGFTLRTESEAGSHYYQHTDGRMVRVSGHKANKATGEWMERNNVTEIRVDQKQLEYSGTAGKDIS